MKALAVAAVAYNAGHEGQQKEDNWFGKLLTEPLLRAAARYCVLYKCSSPCLHQISSQHMQLSLACQVQPRLAHLVQPHEQCL